MNFAALFEVHARSDPDALAVIDARSRWTYGRLDEYASRFASFLVAQGVEPGDRVVFKAANRVELAICFIGCWKSGAIGVPVNFRLTREDVMRVIDHCAPKLVILAESDEVSPDRQPVLRFHPDRHEGSFWDALEQARPAFVSVGRQDSDIANLLYTSGTTGMPKAVIHTHGMRHTIAGTMAHLFAMSRRDVGLAVSPMFHTGGLSVFCNAMHVGGAVVLMEKWNVEDFARALRAEGVTYMHLVSTVVVDIVRAPQELFEGIPRTMRFTWGGGHATDSELFQRFEQRVGGLCLQGYSRTEGGITYNLLDPASRRFDMNGYPSRNNSEIAIYDPKQRRFLPEGETGEIVVRGDGVSPGYWHPDRIQPPVTYEDGWTGTGDIGYFDESGALHFLGREDHMIKTGGENVYPGEVVAVLMQVPGVADAVVFDVPDDRLGQRIAALVVAADPSLTEAQIEAACRMKLPGFKIPRTIALVESLPRLGSNKVDLNACRAHLMGSAQPVLASRWPPNG
jgi:acyl-CoA synthetase (AMP-forming)/AMP-acid ligase II